MDERCMLNESQIVLTNMDQYHYDRDEFCNTVRSVIDIELLLDAFCYGEFNQSEYFAWFRDEDEYYIIHKPSGMMINWYKHLGRTNTCSQNFRTLEDLREFFKLFKEDLEYWVDDQGYKIIDNRIREKCGGRWV